MKINEFSKVTGIPKRTIHYYIDEGLLSPGKTENNYYDFSKKDVQRRLTLSILRQAGVSIDSIKSLDRYPSWLNYYLMKTVRQLSEEIVLKQIQIENAMILLDNISPDATPFDLTQTIQNKFVQKPANDIVSNLYSVNRDFMVTTFIFVGFVNGVKSFYNRYIWEQISKELRKYVGDYMDILRDIIDSNPVPLLTEQTANIMKITNRILDLALSHDNSEFLANRIISISENGQYLDKWKSLYNSLICPLKNFYNDVANNMLPAYYPSYTMYLSNVDDVIQQASEILKQKSDFEKIQSLFGEYFDFENKDTISDYFIALTFTDSFYTL